ncbi:hypothetical protein GQ53DRAFT_464143 [Thozetella sp. PMI_491]|nr:hypothetical protein GQ53DRAFT_464143 [Thozetella sp. PMI_491]
MAHPTTSLYKSLPLSITRKSIRVIEIRGSLDGSNDELASHSTELQVDMHVIDLVDRPVFTALSYVWGSYRSPPHKLCCRGFSINITSNCWSALHQLQKKFGHLLIWVDSVSIDQQNDREKETQIPLMTDIYSSAASVYIWLGQGTPESDLAISYLKTAGFQNQLMPKGEMDYYIPRDAWSYWKAAWILLTKRSNTFIITSWNYGKCAVLSCIFLGFAAGLGTLSVNFKAPPDQFINYESLDDLFSRQWASRIWTLQEVILAKRPILLCGDHELEWKCFLYSMTYLEHAVQYYGVAVPEPGYTKWKTLKLLWLFLSARNQDTNFDRVSQISAITPETLMPEYWYFLERSTKRYRLLARSLLTLHIGVWTYLLYLLNLLLKSIAYQMVGAVVALVALVTVGISVAAPVFQWPINLVGSPGAESLGIPGALIHELCARKATDSRDKSFGMHAIFSRLGVGMPTADYTKSPEQVHREVFMALLAWTKSLGLLLCANGSNSNYNSSWVPNWNEDLAHGWFDSTHLFQKNQYNATPKSVPAWSFREEGRHLVLRGTVISSVLRHNDSFREINEETIRSRHENSFIMEQLMVIREYSHRGRPALTRFGETHLGSPESPSGNLATELTVWNVGYWAERINILAKCDRVLFQTRLPGREAVGTCPKQVEIGDLIALVSGFSLPLLLRQQGNIYLLVGFAEIDGVMNGELWENIAAESLEEIVIA